MVRRLVAVAAALLISGLTVLGGAAPAFADDVPFDPISPTDFMRGSLDSLAVVPGEGIVATGWSFDARNPAAANWLSEFQVLTPDGHAGWASYLGGEQQLSRPDVAAAYPDAGPNHGFRVHLGYLGPAGTYKLCARSNFEVLGCGAVTVAAESLSGSVESLTVDSTSLDQPAIRVRGWVADSWASTENPLRYTVSHTDADPQYSYSQTTDGTWATLDRPDVRGAHPGLPGVKGFEERFPTTRPGEYRVCVQAQPRFEYSTNHPADIGCVSATVTVMTTLTAPALTGDAIPGSTLRFTPATWSPTPTQERIAWSNPTWGAPPLRVGSLDYPVTNADVGRTISVGQAVSASGVLGATVGLTSAVVTLPGVTTSRLSGNDRYDVAIANSQSQFPDAATGAPVVYVASGAKFPDALSAGPAAAKQGAALLLTPPDQMLASVRAEMKRLHPAAIVVVGGPATVGDVVVRALEKIAPVTRLGGADRYEVSRAVIDYAFPSGADSAFVVTGNTYPDALSAGAAAGSAGVPVLLTNGGAVSADGGTRAALAKLGAKAVTIVGGTASVNEGVAGSLGSGIAVTRLAGADRYSAAIALNRSAFAAADTVYLATGLTFPDGLSVGPRAGTQHAPLYLVDGTCVPQDVLADIQSLHATKIVLLGGYASIQSSLEGLYACG
ncbi:cell wall-binding repeat-containing protein [Herbiconiux sp. YIM B11900]|uniref:cell wall-binding repeat-containing protein n=1 Tax=Herbiconiux sp. YIM B11900 TaxID=3404131 RepID=UPI003F85BCBB